ncbi:PorT family protein [Rhodocytophaga rosea]|uniref:PorT family protein n=1 Tax=Rhodocytophaga rosea TaxID=2704465 RepID=A0A6C0GH73_9BACT|nr:porin family protein [Rhodocytophaga rosea]QHT67164.1 PorT family protein [Rhodocytophaga rosea]
MKKIALLALFCGLSFAGFSQVKLGLRLAPNISFNGVNSEGSYNNVTNEGSGLRFSAGPIADFYFADNYAFSTGLWYTVKRVGLSGFAFTGEPSNSLYNIQYLQVPVSLKLYTNEVAVDTRVYFQLGGTLDFKIAEKYKEENDNFLYKYSVISDKKVFKPIDAGILLGAGVELIMGENTTVFGGLNYNRGLVNSIGGVEYNGSKVNNDLSVRNSYVSIEIGLKF